MSGKIFNLIKYLIGWPLSAVALIFVVNIIFSKTSSFTVNLSQINIAFLILSICLFYIYFLMRSFLWQLELLERGHKINFRENTYRFSFSELKRYIPGNFWSFLSRASQFSDLGVDNKTLGISLLADIQLVIIGCFFASVFSLPWLLNSFEYFDRNFTSLLPIVLIAIIIYFFVTSFLYKKYDKNSSIISSLILPGFSIYTKIKLCIVSTVTYFIFGLGNYMVFASVFPSPLSQVLELSSFFVFSLLLGYLSFIAPMGLGIREGVITLGLTKIIGLVDAGFFAVFSRIILILSELSFLLLIFIWKKSYQK